MTKKMSVVDGALYLLVCAKALMWLVPLLWMVATAFRPETSPVGSGSVFWGGGLTLDNFRRAWNAAPFSTFYLNTVIIVGSIVLLQMVTVTLGGFVFARDRKSVV